MLRSKVVWGLIVCGLAVAAPVCACAVVDWNEIILEAVTAGQPGPIGMVDIALVQVAVHDSVQAIKRRFEPYHVEIEGAKFEGNRGRRSAAVAAAAHAALVGMYPLEAATLDAAYFNYLADHNLIGDPGILLEQQVAVRILPLRRVNPIPLPPPFVDGTAPGARRTRSWGIRRRLRRSRRCSRRGWQSLIRSHSRARHGFVRNHRRH
jgi:hypothetical protein